jgi:MoxR-like ATPase
MSDWKIFRGAGTAHRRLEQLQKEIPPWRPFPGPDEPDMPVEEPDDWRGATYQPSDEEIDAVNAALYLRRPLLVTGPPGSGKSSLAYAIAHDLELEPVLRWPVNSRSTLADGLYTYDPVGRLRDSQRKATNDKPPPGEDVGEFLRLSWLGTALATSIDRPRVLLIDEIDKSDLDLPNDLLHVLEDGRFPIPELSRGGLAGAIEVPTSERDGKSKKPRLVTVTDGQVACGVFPIILLTSNGEREFPPAFFRRCLRLELKPPNEKRLKEIIGAHLKDEVKDAGPLIQTVLDGLKKQDLLANDQLLNALFLTTRWKLKKDTKEALVEWLMKGLNR